MNTQKLIRAISISALFLVPIFPLIVANWMFFPFITGKAFYFRLLVELAFAGWVILAFLDAKYRPKQNALTIGATVLAVVALAADLLGVNPLRSIWSNFERMEGWLTVIHLWAFFIAATGIFGSWSDIGTSSKRIWHRWLNVSLFVATIIAVYGIVQLAGGAAIHQGSTRIDATLGNAAYMAVYMLFHFFLAGYLFFVARAKQIANAGFLQWAYPILAVLFGFIIFETQTRGTILGLIGGIMLALFLFAIFGKNEGKKSRMRAASILIGIILIGIVFWLCRNTPFVKNNEVLNRIGSISLSDTQTQARAYIWPMALKGFTQRPVLGWGQENFNYIFNANYNPKMWSQEQWFDRAHSVFLDWLTASGAIGFVAYLALYILCIMAIWRSTLSIYEKSVLVGLIAAYAVHNVFVFDNLASYVLFFGVLGFVSSLRESSPLPWLGSLPVRADAVEYIVAPIVVVALVAGVYFLNVKPILANTRLISALQYCGTTGKADPTLFDKALSVNSYTANQEIREQLLSCSANVLLGQYPNPTKQAFFELTMNEIQAQTKATPYDARAYVLGGSFLNSVSQTVEAEPLLVKANELTPDKQTLMFQLATAYINNGKTAEALAILKQAYESDTTFHDAKSAYAFALVLAGKENEARAMFKDDPAIFDEERMAQAYISLKEYPKAIAVYTKLIAADPMNVNLRARLAQIQYTAGMTSKAIETMRAIEKDHPDLTDQIEAAIKGIQK